MKTRVVAFILMALFISLSLAFLSEASQKNHTIEASGILEEEKVAVSIPTELAIIGSGMGKQDKTAVSKVPSRKPAGVIEDLRVRPGELVRTGDILLVIDDGLAEGNLSQVKAQHDFVLASIGNLEEKGVDLTKKRKELDDAEAELKSKRASAQREFSAKFADGKARIAQMEKKLAEINSGLIKARDETTIKQLSMAKLQLEKGLAGARQALEAGRKKFNEGLKKMDDAMAKISDGRSNIGDAVSTVNKKTVLLKKKEEQAKTGVSIAEKLLDATRIRATSHGMIKDLKVEEGSVVYPGQKVMAVAREDVLRLSIYVPLDDTGFIDKGTPVQVMVDAAPGKVFEGRIVAVGEKAIFAPSNMATNELELVRVVKVKVEVGNKDGILKAGMPVDVRIN